MSAVSTAEPFARNLVRQRRFRLAHECFDTLVEGLPLWMPTSVSFELVVDTPKELRGRYRLSFEGLLNARELD